MLATAAEDELYAHHAAAPILSIDLGIFITDCLMRGYVRLAIAAEHQLIRWQASI